MAASNNLKLLEKRFGEIKIYELDALEKILTDKRAWRMQETFYILLKWFQAGKIKFTGAELSKQLETGYDNAMRLLYKFEMVGLITKTQGSRMYWVIQDKVREKKYLDAVVKNTKKE